MRERTRTRVDVRMGNLMVSELLLKKMERHVAGRVAILHRDPAGVWWWMGHRKVGSNGRAVIDGRQLKVSPRNMEVEGVGERVFMVTDNYTSLKHPAPFPLTTMEDVERYKATGVHGGVSGHAIARLLGWRGCNASGAADLLRGAVVEGLKHRDAGRLENARAAAEVLVEFPAAEEVVKVSLTWRDVADLMVRVERLERLVDGLI